MAVAEGRTEIAKRRFEQTSVIFFIIFSGTLTDRIFEVLEASIGREAFRASCYKMASDWENSRIKHRKTVWVFAGLSRLTI